MLTVMRISFVLAVCAIFLSANSLFAVEEQRRNQYDVFSSATLEKQKEELIKLFKERIDRSQNMYYHLEETVRLRKEENGKEGAYLDDFFFRTNYTHWLYNDYYRMQMERCKSLSNTPREWIDSMYDGEKGVNHATASLANIAGRNFGRIDTQQSSLASDTYYWRFLTNKFYIRSDKGGLMSKNCYLFPHFIENQKSIQIILLPERGKIQAEVNYVADYSFTECTGKRTLILDPEKGFLPLSGVSRYDGIDEGRKFWREEKFIVEETKLVNDIWMPTQITFTISTSSVVPRLFEINEMKVKDISFGTVTKKDVELQFPEGTEVVDAIEGISYKTDAKGKPIESTIEPLYGLDPSSVAKAPVEKRGLINYIFTGAGLLLIAAALYLMLIKRTVAK